MLKSVRVPERFEPSFAVAEGFVESLFSRFRRNPEEGTIHVGEDRYVLMRAESFYLAWSHALEQSFGKEAARELLYNTAREIGRADCGVFSARLGVTDGVARLAAGPVHFAHAGWAFVDILPDSAPTPDDSYCLHYVHPNTFESEVLAANGRTVTEPACLFSAGYSAGWCSEAFDLDLHAREIRCLARGDARCEFVMSPGDHLDGLAARVLEG